MEIHNVMEDFVHQMVDEVFEEKKKSGFSLADCYQCRLDVACYVLNRIKPEYIISGRGLAHYQSQYQNQLQKTADVVALINDGIRKIEHRRRPYYDYAPAEEEYNDQISTGPVYNFPALIGRILHGQTFEPIKDIHVGLMENGEPVTMMDYTWQNPYYLVESTRGHFTFLPRPVKAKQTGQRKKFSLEICTRAEEFTPIHHYFELELTAERQVVRSFSINNTYKVGDLYLFPEDQPMEINE